MVDITKPIYGDIWANAGETLNPGATKIATGWIQEMMPYQFENFLQNRTDIAISYLLQKGIPEWSAEQEYIANKSVVTYGSQLYMATATTTNVLPTVSSSWKRLTISLGVNGAVPVSFGGTGATNAADARVNLGIGTSATADFPDTNGLISNLANNTLVARTITGTTGYVTVTNGNGVSGNPTINVGENVAKTDADAAWSTKTSIKIPSGTSSERGVGAPGRIRFNMESGVYEGYDNTGWNPIGSTGTLDVQNFSGDGVKTSFTMSTTPRAENNTQVYFNGVYQQKNSYNLVGSNLVFDKAPALGIDIEVVTVSSVAIGTTTAGQTSIVDSGNYFSSGSVEGALQEVGLKASFVKDAILSYPDYAAASAAATSLPDGQVVVVDGVSQGRVKGGSYVPESGPPSVTFLKSSDIRSYSGQQTLGTVGSRSFKVSTTADPDNGIDVIQDARGRKWRQQDVDRINVEWAGATPESTSNDVAFFWAAARAVELQIPLYIPKAVWNVKRFAVDVLLADNTGLVIISDGAVINRINDGSIAAVTLPDGRVYSGINAQVQTLLNVKTKTAQSISVKTGTYFKLIGDLEVVGNSAAQWDQTDYSKMQFSMGAEIETDDKHIDTLRCTKHYGNGLKLAHNQNVIVKNYIARSVGGHWYQSEGYDAFGDALYFGYNKPGANIEAIVDAEGFAGSHYSRAGVVFEYSTGSDYTAKITPKLSRYERTFHIEENSGLQLDIASPSISATPIGVFLFGTPTSITHRIDLHGGSIDLLDGTYNGSAGWVAHYNSNWKNVNLYGTKVVIREGNKAPNLLGTNHYGVEINANSEELVFAHSTGLFDGCRIFGLKTQPYYFYEGRGRVSGGSFESDVYDGGLKVVQKNGDRPIELAKGVNLIGPNIRINADISRSNVITDDVAPVRNAMRNMRGVAWRDAVGKPLQQLGPFGLPDPDGLVSAVRVTPGAGGEINLDAVVTASSQWLYAPSFFLLLRAHDGREFDSLQDYENDAYYIIKVARYGSSLFLPAGGEKNFTYGTPPAYRALSITAGITKITATGGAALVDIIAVPTYMRPLFGPTTASGEAITVI